MPDTVKGNVTVHRGERYGGGAQKVVNFVDSDARLTRMRNVQVKFGHPPSGDATPQDKHGFVDPKRIQWVLVTSERYFDVDSRRIPEVVVNKGLSQKIGPFRSLYATFAKEMRILIGRRQIDPRARLVVRATGTDPEYKREFGTLIKLVISGSEFVLPNSFSRDFKEAILSSNP